MGTVVLVGTMDTKGKEYLFAKECIEKAGEKALLMDIGILEDSGEEVDIPSNKVSEAAGYKIDALRTDQEGDDARAKALDVMKKGAFLLLNEMIRRKECDGVFGMGGSGGTSVLGAIFQKLPVGFPKMLVSTIASGNTEKIVGDTDITLMYSVTDIAGLNQVSCRIIGNAANGIAGMVKNRETIPIQEEHKPLIAITMFGVTTKGVMCVRKILEQHGFDIIVFHCTGSGGRAMEKMIESGLINGVVDYTTAELNGHYITGMNDAGEERMTTASKKKIPQIVVPGAIEVCNFPGKANVPEEYSKPERKLIEHNPLICAAKASEEELIMLGSEFAKKVKTADARCTRVIFPLNGLDAYEAENGPWHDREEDEKLFHAIREEINGKIPIEEIDANINDTEFAEKVAENFLDIWKLTQKNISVKE